ncbi:MAG TPA: hypothetical protein VMY59_08110, partial [Candidatus Thermoplasmatota archaeon]|nr:hypothetical protein [Candidatus Thermoplasmatota archaeon]
KKLYELLKKPIKKLVWTEKPKKKPPVQMKKSVKKPKKELVKSIPPAEDTSKEETIAKIKKEQQKQLRRQKL